MITLLDYIEGKVISAPNSCCPFWLKQAFREGIGNQNRKAGGQAERARRAADEAGERRQHGDGDRIYRREARPGRRGGALGEGKRKIGIINTTIRN